MQVSRDLRTTLKESASMKHDKLREREVNCRLKSCYSSYTSKSKIYRPESVLTCASTSADGVTAVFIARLEIEQRICDVTSTAWPR